MKHKQSVNSVKVCFRPKLHSKTIWNASLQLALNSLMAPIKHSMWHSLQQVFTMLLFFWLLFTVWNLNATQFRFHHELIRFSLFELFSGYNYSFPFLSVDSGISVHDNMVEPLYKQILNIKYPTMAFIGIPFTTPTNPLFDLQVRLIKY